MLARDYFAATLPLWEEMYHTPTLYAAIYRERLERALELAAALRPSRDAAALDVGCGPGLGAVGLARLGLQVCAADSLSEMVDRTLARARHEGHGTRVSGLVAELGALPFPSDRFDLVFVIGVSEWLESLAPALAELARVLRPGGHLVLSADNAWALSCLVDPLEHPLVVPLKRALGRALHRLLPQRRRLARTRGYSRRALDRALVQAGLARIESVTIGFGPFTWLHRPLLSERAGQALDRRLRQVPGLRSAGLVHVLLARKTGLCAKTA